MANTIDSDLVGSIVTDTVTLALQDRLAALETFTRDFSNEIMSPQRRTIHIRKATAGSTTQTNPTNFETGDSTLAEIPVTCDLLSQDFHISATDFQQGTRLKHLLQINAHNLANKIWDVVMALAADDATFTLEDGLASGTKAADLAALWTAIEKSPMKGAVLSGSLYSLFLPTDLNSFNPGNRGVYGFDTFHHATRFPAGLLGFVAGPDAIAIGAAIPEWTNDVNRSFTMQETFTLPGLGMSVQFNQWTAMASRKTWASFDLMFGAAIADATALVRIVAP